MPSCSEQYKRAQPRQLMLTSQIFTKQNCFQFCNFAMKIKLSSSSIRGLILILVPLALSTSPVMESLPDRRSPAPTPYCPTMKSIGKVCDFGPGLPFKKKVQLYSRTSGRFIQIKKTELDASGKNGSQYSRLVLESDFFGRIKIRGETTNRYLCLNKKGKLFTRARKQKFAAMKLCEFKEEYSEGYFRYKSVKYPKCSIGFTRQGKPRSRRNGATKHRYRHFIRYDLPNKTKRKHRRDAKHRKKKFIKLLQKELRMRWSL